MKRPAHEWALEPHVCGLCLGRVVSRNLLTGEGAGTREYRCTNCGVTGAAVGTRPGSVCACRMRVGAKDAGIRCVENTDRRPEFPSEFIAKEIA